MTNDVLVVRALLCLTANVVQTAQAGEGRHVRGGYTLLPLVPIALKQTHSIRERGSYISGGSSLRQHPLQREGGCVCQLHYEPPVPQTVPLPALSHSLLPFFPSLYLLQRSVRLAQGRPLRAGRLTGPYLSVLRAAGHTGGKPRCNTTSASGPD